MNNNKFTEHIRLLNEFDEREYLYYTIAYNAAPTIVQEKPSSLLIFSNNKNLKNNWDKYKEEIKNNLKIDFFELENNEEITVVLFYNKDMLENILRIKRNSIFLRRFKYNEAMSLEESLQHLSSRYGKMCPHEIGIFLGYPVADVAVFTHCPNKKCLMVGYWKVYFNEEYAKKIFDKYDVAKNIVIGLMVNGIKPTQIIKQELLKIV